MLPYPGPSFRTTVPRGTVLATSDAGQVATGVNVAGVRGRLSLIKSGPGLVNATFPDATIEVQSSAEEMSANFQARHHGFYTVLSSLTVTDPSTPASGHEFTVLVRNGTATVGGLNYATAGSVIRRVWHSGSWTNYEYPNLSAANSWSALQTFSSAAVSALSDASIPMAAATTKTLTNSGVTVDSTESVSLINLSHGAAPTTPLNGDLWTTTGGLFARIAGTSQQVACLGLTGAFSASLVTSANLGFATGAGGTVTQATSKSTGVTLNKQCGTITMNGATLASATSVSFVLTNSTIAADDYVMLKHVSAGTLAGYSVVATEAPGSCTITVRNNTAGSLSEAIVLRFAVIKAVVA